LIVTEADADFVESVTDVAVTVTALDGTAEGAVNVVAAPLDVVVGLNDPQEPLGAQLQVTPAFAESLLTVAVMEASPLTVSDEGAPLIVMLIALPPPPPPPPLLDPPLHAIRPPANVRARIVRIV
jgi:hypothetical protein